MLQAFSFAYSELHWFLVNFSKQALWNHVSSLLVFTWKACSASLSWTSPLAHNQKKTWKHWENTEKPTSGKESIFFQQKVNHWMHWMQMSRNSWMWQVQGPLSKKPSQESPREDKTDRENICSVSATHLHLLSERSFGREVIRLYRLIDEKLSKFTPWHN